MMIKIGLIGAGFMGKTHLSCYEELVKGGGVQVTAIADAVPGNAEKCAESFGAKPYLSGRELLENADVNTVDICLPTYLHARHAVAAMEKGYNVFIEKPVCLLEEEAEKLLEMQRKTGAKVAVGQCLRFWPEYMFLKKIFDAHTYGKLLSGVFKRLGARPDGWEEWYRDGSKSGSAALDLHIHDVDFVRYLLGEPASISGGVRTTKYGDEHVYSLYRYDGAVISLEGGWDHPSGMPFEMEYRVNFEKAMVVFNSRRAPTLAVYHEDGSVEEPAPETEFNKQKDNGGNISSLGAYYNELKYFLECLKTGREITVAPLKEGVASFRLDRKELSRIL